MNLAGNKTVEMRNKMQVTVMMLCTRNKVTT